MKIAQTSFIVFISKILGSSIGFVATVYFARILGAEIIGIYSLIIVIVSWLILVGRGGISSALTKRISEGDEQDAYLGAGILSLVAVAVGISILVFLGKPSFEMYVSGFEQYATVSVIWFILLLLLIRLSRLLVSSTLKGQRLVHVTGILQPVRIGFQSLLQIALVFLGFGLIGMLVGYALGIFISVIVGIVFVTIRPRFPTGRHLRSLLDFAKFSWLGGLKARAFNDADLLVLGALVPSSLVGIYAVAWSLTQFINLFADAIRQTIFPEISNISAQDSMEATRPHIEDSFAYAGFIAIPGFVGGTLLADRLFRIYGPEFVLGTQVLWLLLLSILLYGFVQQCLNVLNAVDRPDVAFRVNIVFLTTNIVLNIILVMRLGWVGAAMASAISAFVALVFSYGMLSRIVFFKFPIGEISRQVFAAMTMAGVVWSIREAAESTGTFRHNFLLICILVTIGASVYILVLFVISAKFRTTVRRNLPYTQQLG